MRYLVRAIIFGSVFGSTCCNTFSAAKVLLFFDIHEVNPKS